MSEQANVPDSWVGQRVTVYKMSGGWSAHTLAEVNDRGIVLEEKDGLRFVPWTAVSEIYAGEKAKEARKATRVIR